MAFRVVVRASVRGSQKRWVSSCLPPLRLFENEMEADQWVRQASTPAKLIATARGNTNLTDAETLPILYMMALFERAGHRVNPANWNGTIQDLSDSIVRHVKENASDSEMAVAIFAFARMRRNQELKKVLKLAEKRLSPSWPMRDIGRTVWALSRCRMYEPNIFIAVQNAATGRLKEASMQELVFLARGFSFAPEMTFGHEILDEVASRLPEDLSNAAHPDTWPDGLLPKDINVLVRAIRNFVCEPSTVDYPQRPASPNVIKLTHFLVNVFNARLDGTGRLDPGVKMEVNKDKAEFLTARRKGEDVLMLWEVVSAVSSQLPTTFKKLDDLVEKMTTDAFSIFKNEISGDGRSVSADYTKKLRALGITNFGSAITADILTRLGITAMPEVPPTLTLINARKRPRLDVHTIPDRSLTTLHLTYELDCCGVKVRNQEGVIIRSGDGKSEYCTMKLDHDRDRDAEAVALSYIAQIIRDSKTETPRKVSGWVMLHLDAVPCVSCLGVISQFRRRFPQVRLKVHYFEENEIVQARMSPANVVKVSDMGQKGHHTAKSNVCEQLLGQIKHLDVSADLSNLPDNSKRGKKLDEWMDILRSCVAARDPPKPAVFELLFQLAVEWRRPHIAEEIQKIKQSAEKILPIKLQGCAV